MKQIGFRAQRKTRGTARNSPAAARRRRLPLFSESRYARGMLYMWVAGEALMAVSGAARADDASPGGPATPAGAVSPGKGKQDAQAQPAAAQVDTVVVTTRAASRIDTVKEDLSTIPGGTSVVDSAIVQKGRTSTNADVLALQPGVFAQSAGGADGLKISIRGSDINSGTNYFRTGILFLFDGLPVTGPSGTPYELFEPLGLSYTAILRGANAFDLGALSLGGAINYVTKTGYDAAPFQARFEIGSFGYTKEQVSSGGVIGNFDYFVSLTNSYRSGYQDNTAATGRGIVANFGYKITPDITTRFYIRYRQTENRYPGELTKQQIEDNPTQAQSPYGTPLYNSTRIQPGSTWIANKTTFKLDDTSQIEGGFVYHNYPIDIEEGVNAGKWGYTDISGVLDYKRVDLLWGRESDTDIGISATRTLNGWQDTDVRIPTALTANIPLGTTIRHAVYGGQDIVLHASNDIEVVPRWWLTTGLAVSNSQRSTAVTYPATPYAGYSNDTWSVSPRLGLRFKLTPDIQIFANVSRSVEPPMDWEFLSGPTFTAGPVTSLTAGPQNLLNQSALTFELGTTGKFASNQWSLALYHSAVRHELLEVETAQATATTDAIISYSNASNTTHEGIEAGLTTELWSRPQYVVSYRQAYTFSNFFYNHDPVFGGNHLPGIPRHFYQGQLRLDTVAGFYLAANVQVSSRIDEDYANTVSTKPYQTFGVTLGYEKPSEGWSAYLDFQNLSNEHYAATVDPTYNDHGVDTNQLTPGDGIGVFAGVSFTWK
jgi:iron complex outermembrane recepter protein